MDYLGRIDIQGGYSEDQEIKLLEGIFSDLLISGVIAEDTIINATILVDELGYKERWLRLLANGDSNKPEDLLYEVVREFCTERRQEIEKCMHRLTEPQATEEPF